MSLAAGTKLGPYSVIAQIGAGGMGEVYQARDTKLNRDVALKVLPDDFAADPERLARFQREAQVLASLNHPNIAQIHGLEDSTDTLALVLELVPGPTLQDRIAQGAIPLDEALPIAKQIAEALEAAHEQGIIHRDLKPANIKITPEGVVKVLDFGLAKALEPDRTPDEIANSPTMTAAATKMGVLMGTAAYMSPEQARGKPVDKRADIWAFGVVFLEMVTGQKVFEGEDVSLTLSSVLQREPDWEALPPSVPPLLTTFLRRCLEKDPKRRVRDIGDVRLAMEGAFEREASGFNDTGSTRVPTLALWQRPMPLVIAGAALVALSSLTVWSLARPTSSDRQVSRFQMVLPPEERLTRSIHYELALSPDAAHLAYTANGQLYIRALDQIQAIPVRETDGASEPFFSPDGQWVGFYADGQLKKVSVGGGAPVVLCEIARAPYGISWSPDDTILFNLGNQGVLRVPGTGGTPELVLPLEEGQNGFIRPQLLPGGEWVLFSAFPSQDVALQSLVTGERRVLIEDGGGDVLYVTTGHLLLVRNGSVLAVPFDLREMTLTGGPVPLVEDVQQAANGVASLAVSASGSLVYLPGGPFSIARTLVWMDREGQAESLAVEPRFYQHPRISPDGTLMAVTTSDYQEADIWIWNFARETLTRLTVSPEGDSNPVWTPDGERVAFRSNRDGPYAIFWRAADGTGTVEQLGTSLNARTPHAFTPDGSRLVFRENHPDTGADLWVLAMDGERSSEALLTTEFNEFNQELSPDGRWLAYQSNASGQDEIYVRPFPNVDEGRWQVSSGGGFQPMWGPDGRELFYRTFDRLLTVGVQSDPSFRAGNPEVVVAVPLGGSPNDRRSYDISPDGRRFLMVKEGGEAGTSNSLTGLDEIHIVLNWFEELKARVPTP